MFEKLTDLELADTLQQAMGDLMKIRDAIIELKKELAKRKSKVETK